MFQHSSPTARSEPTPGTPRKTCTFEGTDKKATQSATPQKRKVDIFGSSPALSPGDSVGWASTPLTPLQYGVSSFQQRLRTACIAEYEGGSIPSSPPERYSRYTNDFHVADFEAETPSKRVKHATAPPNDHAFHDFQCSISGVASAKREGASPGATRIEYLLSQLSTETTLAKSVSHNPHSGPCSKTISSDDEDPFMGTSSDRRSSYPSPDTSLPDEDQAASSNKENAQSRGGDDITAENAQSILLPQACVFAANLPRSESDDAIQDALVEAFSPFGQCWVKVLRSHSDQMPYAFVQYKTSEEAHIAVEQGRGADVLGRPCRTEVARAHRAVYVSRRDGSCPTRVEILNLLVPFGEIEAVVFPSETDMNMHDLQPGGWARFRIFGDCKDAIQQLQTNITYFVRQAKELTPKKQLFQTNGHHGHPRDNFRRLRSIRVGWLPSDVTESQVRERFQAHGHIRHLGLRPTSPRVGPNTAAIITYDSWKNAENAVNAEDNLVVIRDGQKRRVKVDYTIDDDYQASIKQQKNRPPTNQAATWPFSPYQPMRSVSVYPSGAWIPGVPTTNMFWPNNASVPQPFHPTTAGVGGPLQMPFFGMPMQFWPGTIHADYSQVQSGCRGTDVGIQVQIPQAQHDISGVPSHGIVPVTSKPLVAVARDSISGMDVECRYPLLSPNGDVITGSTYCNVQNTGARSYT